MKMTERIEKAVGIELKEWQKNHIRFLESLHPCVDARIVIDKNGRFYSYIYQITLKELIQNGTFDH